MTEIKAQGGRIVPLKVGGAFHSPFMEEAAKAFAKELEKAELKERSIPLYANRTAGLYPCAAADVIELLSTQISSPVLWERLIRRMIADGINTFVELGPGKTLTNMNCLQAGIFGSRYCSFIRRKYYSSRRSL